MDRFISRTRQVWFAMALLILSATLPGAAQARSSGGAREGLAAAPKEVAFPDKVFGSSGETSWPKRLRISASKKSDRIESISIGGANRGDFALHQAENCVGAPVAAGCAVTVTFTPNGLGKRTARLLVTDTSGAIAESVPLSGRGIKGAIKWQPREISFGKVQPGGSSTPEAVSISNPNGTPLTITSISLDSGNFVATLTQNCMGPLAPHASCKFYVAANPQSAMAKSHKDSIHATLDIRDDAAGNPHRVKLSVVSGSAVSSPPPPATLAREILVTNTPCNNVTSYPVGGSGNVAPTFPQPLLCTPTGIAVDANKNIYVTNSGDDGNPSYSVAIYPAGSTGQVPPNVVIAGSATGLDDPHGIALDGSGNIYVVNDGSNNGDADSLTVYPAGSTGNATPSAVISGSNTGLNLPVGVAIFSGKIYVANGGNPSVTVYPVGSPGNAAPSATISGFDTGLMKPTGVALDSGGNIYVVDSGCACVNVYSAGSSGNATPSATIFSGLIFPTGIALDSGNNVYVVDNFGDSVFVYTAGTFVLSATITGSATDLDNPVAIAIDSTAKIYVANDGAQVGDSDTVSVYPAGLSGTVNATPSAIINGEFALTNNDMDEPVGIALDSTGNIYVSNSFFDVDPIAVYSAGSGATGGASAGIDDINFGTGVALDSAQNVYAVSSKQVDIVSSLDSGFSNLGILSGDTTELSDAAGIALDANENLYVTNDADDLNGDRVTIYPAESTGNTVPSAVIVGPNTGLAFPEGIAIDSAGNIYVANAATDAITVYPQGSNGNVAPSATISGPSTLLDTPSAVALDSNGLIYITNEGGYEGGNVSVTVYAAGATGNATPVTTISGAQTQLARPRGIAIVPAE